jgi:hypothetical protein
MVPDPEYTVREVKVWRVVGPDGRALMDEDDHGEYPRDFDSYEDAFHDAAEHMQCSIPYGPRTKAEQAISDSFAQMAKIVSESYSKMFGQQMWKPLPFASDKTIQFFRSA